MKDLFGNEDNEFVLMRKYYILNKRLQEIHSSNPYWYNHKGTTIKNKLYL